MSTARIAKELKTKVEALLVEYACDVEGQDAGAFADSIIQAVLELYSPSECPKCNFPLDRIYPLGRRNKDEADS
jgi:hypothetical protein